MSDEQLNVKVTRILLDLVKPLVGLIKETQQKEQPYEVAARVKRPESNGYIEERNTSPRPRDCKCDCGKCCK